MADLAGRTAIVTGGARGIGRAVCQLLAERGSRLVVNHNASRAAAEELVAAVNAGGGEAIAVAGSIADPATGPALAAAAMEAFGRIDILVNNAGVTRDATVRKMTDEDFTAVIDVNLTGTHRVTRAVVEPMCAAGFGRIVTVSSFVGELGNFGQANYAAAKGGLIAWTKSLALELARFGVTANCICPGFTDTDMLRRRARADPRAAARRACRSAASPARRDRAGGRLRRLGGRLHDRHLPRHQRRAVHVSGPLGIGSRADAPSTSRTRPSRRSPGACSSRPT